MAMPNIPTIQVPVEIIQYFVRQDICPICHFISLHEVHCRNCGWSCCQTCGVKYILTPKKKKCRKNPQHDLFLIKKP